MSNIVQAEDSGVDLTVPEKEGTFKFKRLKDRKPGEAWILMIYGPSKTGKTYFAGTAGGRTLFLNLGEGIETLLSPAFLSRYGKVAEEMIIVDIRENNPQSESEAFDVVCKATDYALAHFVDQFDTVVMDEATAFRKFALNKSMDLNTATRKDPKARESRLDTFVKPDIGDYGTEMQMIEWYLGTYIPIFKERGKNFIMLAHQRQIYGKPPSIGAEAPLLKTLPGFTGKTFPDTVPAYFDDVWLSESAGPTVYRLRTYGNDKQVGGSRHGGIFQSTESDPNFLKLLERIRSTKR